MLDGCVPWPEEFAERYRREGYWQGVTLGGLPRAWASQYGDRTALIHDEKRLSYDELDAAADCLAAQLLRLKIRPLDRVVVHLPNVPEFLVLCFALFRIGALPVLAMPAHREHEIRYLCEFSQAVAYVTPPAFGRFDCLALARSLRESIPALRQVLVAGDYEGNEFVHLEALLHRPIERDAGAEVAELVVDPSEVALFLLSGGTTGVPKLIPRSHEDYVYNLRQAAMVCGFDAETTYLVALPIAHNFPLGCPGVLGTLNAGGRVVLTANPNAPTAFPIIERERVTTTALVPTLAIRWMEAPERERFDLSSLRLLQVGGARLNPEVARRVRPTLGCALQQVFGMAEGLLNFTRLDDPEDLIVETQGRPMSPADELRVVDANDRPLPEGEPGELLTRGPYTLRGYYRAAEHNAGAFTRDGFYRTGDVVRLLPSGHLVVEGRTKDMINRGGEKISAEEVENLILAHPAVSNAAAVAMPDPMLGERTCAYVVLHTNATLALEELVAFLRDRGVATYKLPERLECVSVFPLTSVGKISKTALRADIAGKLRGEGS